jgi:hypothetical protein
VETDSRCRRSCRAIESDAVNRVCVAGTRGVDAGDWFSSYHVRQEQMRDVNSGHTPPRVARAALEAQVDSQRSSSIYQRIKEAALGSGGGALGQS